MSALIDCPHCATRVLPTSGRICPACLKNVDYSPDRKPKPNPPETSVSGVTPEPKRERAAPPMISQPDPSGSVEETIIPASPGNALQRRAPKYKTYEEVPWHRREPGALVFAMVLLFAPVTVALCLIALTGEVYRNAYDKHGNLEVWGPGNKMAAVLILLLQGFIIWAYTTLR
jgi:hypothetical protein